jgi:hypothetical protein
MIKKLVQVKLLFQQLIIGVKRHISAFEQKTKIHISDLSEENLLVLHRKLDSLNLWLVNKENNNEILLLADIRKKNNSNIITSNISRNGKYLAYSDSEQLVLFQYDFQQNEIKKIKSFKNVSGIRYIFFSPDENVLIFLNQIKCTVTLYNIKTQILDIIEYNNFPELIIACDLSVNGKSLIFSTLNKNVFSIDLEKRQKQQNLPQPSNNFITQLNHINDRTAIIIADDNKFYLINLETAKFTKWTIKNIDHYPKNYLTWYNRIFGVSPSFINDEQFLLYTDYNFIKIDLSKEIPNFSIIEKNKQEKIRNADWAKLVKEYHRSIFNQEYKGGVLKFNEIYNSKPESSGMKQSLSYNKHENDNFKIISRFSSILYMTYLHDEKAPKLLVIENDWNKLIKEFPDAITKFRYGN